MRRLVDVPAPVAQVAQLALTARAARKGGGTARGVVIATALANGHATWAEVLEARDWHHRNDEEVQGDRTSLLGGLYGGAPGRSWLTAIAAARNPEGKGAMVALPVPPEVTTLLAEPDGEPPEAMHLTLFHLTGNAAELGDEVRARFRDVLAVHAAAEGAPTITLSHVERFTATDEGLEPVVAVSDSPDVYVLRGALEGALRGDGLPFSDNHAFRAHVTIGYYPPGDGPEPGPLDRPYSFQPPTVNLHWGPEVDAFELALPEMPDAAAAAGWYVLQDGYPVDGPIEDRKRALDQVEPGDDGIVYVDGSAPRLLARAALDPPARAFRRRRARLRKVQAATRAIDRDLAARVHAAAEVALAEAIDKARRTLRNKARNNAQKDALVASSGLATPAVLAALGLEEQRLVAHAFDTVADRFRDWTRAAERRKLAIAAREFVPDPALGEDPDPSWTAENLEARFGTDIDRRTETAAGLLAAALGYLALRRLTRGPDTPGPGEQRGDVPFRIVRGPLELVRTGREPPVVVSRTGDDLPRMLRPLLDEAASNIDRLLAEREPGAVRSGVWVHGYYGDPTTPFEPHADLDGLGSDEPLTGPDDERLAKDPGEFPEGSYYWPDDHDGCTCEIEESVDLPAETPQALAASAISGGAPPLPAASSALARVAERSAARQS